MQGINKPIGVIDSGIGGVSVLRALKDELPNEDYIYIADKKHFPYGEKSNEFIKERVKDVIGWLNENNAKMVVIACNTATVAAINDARNAYPKLDIIGTVPAVKPASKTTKNGNIGVLSTSATYKSAYGNNLISDFAGSNNVFTEAAPELVEYIENGKDENEISLTIEPYTKKLTSNNIDTLVLGCSHFPLVKTTIQNSVGDRVQVIDSGSAVAKRVKLILEESGSLRNNNKSPGIQFYTTGEAENFGTMVDRYLNMRARVDSLDI